MATRHTAQFKSGGRRTDIDDPRFEYLGLTHDKTKVAVILDDGRSFCMPVDNFSGAEDWDESGMDTVEIIDKGIAGLVHLDSGKSIDFPDEASAKPSLLAQELFTFP